MCAFEINISLQIPLFSIIVPLSISILYLCLDSAKIIDRVMRRNESFYSDITDKFECYLTLGTDLS